MVDLALHIEYRNSGSLCHKVEIAIAHSPIHMSDGDPVEIPAKDIADFPLCVPVSNLSSLRLDKRRMSAELCHS